MLHLGIGAGLRDLLDEPVLRYVDRLAGGLFGLLDGDADRYIPQQPSDHLLELRRSQHDARLRSR